MDTQINHIKGAAVLAVVSAFLLCGCACSQEKTEENLPQKVESKLWARVTDGDKHLNPKDYYRAVNANPVVALAQSYEWSGCAWRNDHAASRLDFCTYEQAYNNVSIVVSDFECRKGGVIPSENITATYLSAVETKSEAYPEINYQVYDIISRDTCRDLEAGKVYAAWVDIYVPEGTPEGEYTGTVILKSGDLPLAQFDYTLEVQPYTLTNPEEWETFLDLWETPFASNRYYSGKSMEEFFNFTTPIRQDTNPFSLYYVRLDPKYQAGLESELELYHKAGGNCISVQTVEAPDNSRFPCATPSMIKWILQKDGTFRWDYTDMDYYVDLNFKHGINRQIDLFYHTGVGWGFVYYDESTGKVSNHLSANPGEPRWREISRLFLNDLAAHLEEKGWFDIAVLYMDERLFEVTKQLVEAAEEIHDSKGNQLKVGGAVNGNECAPLYDRMYDISHWENTKNSEMKAMAASRREKGLQTTLYTCGSGKMATVCQPAEAAFAVYEAKKYNMDGVMRWALNKFDEDPLHGTLHTTCYPGDCYLIYPDEQNSPLMQAQSSPRFEKLCEGMRYTEKLNILRKLRPDFNSRIDDIVYGLSTGGFVDAAAGVREKVDQLSREK